MSATADPSTMHPSLSGAFTRNSRVLVIDDNAAIHADFRKILCPTLSDSGASLDALEAQLLGTEDTPVRSSVSFTLDSAHQGQEGVELVRQAVASGHPYAMAFVDVRMPPGWDGIETTLALWKIAPDLQVVICTAYSDYSWVDMFAQLGSSDRLLVLKKPFDTIEVLQLTNALTEKWNLAQQAGVQAALLEQRVLQRTFALEATNRALQAEILRRLAMEIDLKRAKDAAESADQAKSAFLANMSHEIRTPMNGVIGMANLLLTSALSLEQRDLADTLRQSSESLLTIINDILDFSKIDAGRLTLEAIDFDLSEHLELAVDLHADAAAHKALELVMQVDADVPSRVRGDPIRLRQVILNLLSNAIKFTAKGEVVLRVTREGQRDGRPILRFAVTDSGIGIPPSVQVELFQPFVQADSSTTRRFGGTGLGLAICKRLAELMQGEIGIENSGDTGSTFWFTAVFEHPVEPAPVSIGGSLLERHCALVVDDNATSRKLLDHLCTVWQLPHRTAAGAVAAMAELHAAAAAGQPVDLVIFDHHMPEIDGLGLAAMVLADRGIPRPTLVMLTSRGERLSQPEMIAHGLAACELKPVHPEKLRHKLARIMAGSRSPGAAVAALIDPTAPSEAKRGAPGPNGATPIADLSPPPASGPTRVCVLVAEDNLVNQKVTMLQLRNLGYGADIVHNGREAIEALQRKTYALVLMDAQMPEMDGMTATRAIRAAQAAGNPLFPRELFIIAMTANAMAGDRQMCLEAGMDDYLAKPVRSEELREILSRFLERQPAMRQVALAS